MVSIFICGDVINYEHETGEICSPELAKIVMNSDYSVCNFEAPISSSGTLQPKSGPHHYQRVETIDGLRKQGFDLLLLANNHIMDFGAEGLAATLAYAKKVGIDTLGAGLDANSAYKPLIKEFGDIKIGMINACEAQFGVIDHFERLEKAGYAWINHHKIDKLILELKYNCDFIIVFSHAGLENYSIPQKEWRERYKYFCDLGADVIVGSHPHVPQGYERYAGSLIFYSLGNFYFDSKNYKYKEDHTFSIILKLEKDQQLDFQAVYHHKQDGKVQLSPPEKQVDLEKLNLLLEGEKYYSEHEKMSLKAYGKIKQNFIFSLAPIPYDGNIKSSVRRIVLRMLGRSKKIDKDLLQLHLLRNEAYYFAAKNALEVIAKRKYEKT